MKSLWEQDLIEKFEQVGKWLHSHALRHAVVFYRLWLFIKLLVSSMSPEWYQLQYIVD